MLIDGKKISNEVKQEIKEEVIKFEKKYGKPGLAVVLVGDNQASKIYVKHKEKACELVGFHSEKIVLPKETTEKELLDVIKKLNNDEKINGILVQLPLPKHISEQKVIDSISFEKDVDGFHPINLGKLAIGDESGYASCTPYGIMELFKRTNIDLLGKNVTMVGRSNIVGKPLALMMINKGATVTVANSKTKDIGFVTRNADIVVMATGVAKLLKEDMVNEGVTVIDVGMNKDENGKLCGDVDFENVSKKSLYITPVPGGVGPMTIAMLMKNTMKSFKKANKIS